MRFLVTARLTYALTYLSCNFAKRSISTKKYSTSEYMYHGWVCVRCIWHIGKSITTNLAAVLGSQTSEFLQRFYTVNNCVGQAAFKELWSILMEDYPEAENYMEKQFGGENMQRWGLPWQVRNRLTMHN